MKKSDPGALLRDINKRWKNGEFLRDPNFGYEIKGSGTQDLTGNRIAGWRATCPEAGTAQSLTWYLYTVTVGIKCKFALHKVSNNALIAYTEEFTTPSGGYNDWKTLNVVWGGTLEAVDYWIQIWSNSSGFTLYRDTHTYTWKYQDITYDSWPDPWSPTDSYINRKFSSYCTYTPSAPPAAARPVLMDGLVVL